MVVDTAAYAAALARLSAAAGPADLFGSDPGRARSAYRELAKQLHPDHAPAGTQDQAQQAFARLADLWAAHRGGAPAPTLVTRAARYRLGAPLACGDLATLYRATSAPTAAGRGRGAAAGPVVLKMPRDPRNNDLLEQEARVLTHLAEHASPEHLAYLPRLHARFTHRDPGRGVDRRVNVLAELDGFYSLVQVAAAYPGGCDPRDAAWMWRRLLVALGTVHRAGVVHGAVLPEHVLIHPDLHGLVLLDYCYASTGDPLRARVGRYADWYPEEVAARRPPSPATDIAMASRTMAALVGPRLPRPLAAFVRACTLPGQHQRPDDAWALLADLDDVLGRLYGPRRFRPFTMPPPPTEPPDRTP